MRKVWLGCLSSIAVLSLVTLWSMAAHGYESPTLGSFTSTSGTPACVTLPTNLPAVARLAALCRGAPCHYRAQAAGGSTVTQHDSMLLQDVVSDVPVDGSVGAICFVGDASVTVSGDVYRVLP